MNQITNILKNKQLNFIIKWAVLLLSIFFIYKTFNLPENRKLFTNDFFYQSILNNLFLVTFVVFLSIINIGIETIKWSFLVNKFDKITLKNSTIGVLLGFTLSFISPHGIGDYFARISTNAFANKLKLVVSLFLSRISLLIVTIFFGLIGSYFYFFKSNLLEFFWIHVWITLFILIAYFFFPKFISDFIEKYILKNHSAAEYHFLISFKTLFTILILSGLRYIVFIVQFIFFFQIFQINLTNIVLFGGGSFIFLLKSALPTFSFLGDLSIREFAALTYFDLYQIEPEKVVMASISLWVINIVLPAIIGLFFINKIKIS